MLGTVSYYNENHDGWYGEWVRLVVNGGSDIQCLIKGWIDGALVEGDDQSIREQRNFICFPCLGECKGKF